MAKPERNAPCPCGSGNKYKKCCLPTDQAAAMERWERQEAEAVAESLRRLVRSFREDDPLDDLSNSVIDLIDQRRFDEAHEACRRLRDEFPEAVDGIDRQGEVYKAMGELGLAREYFQQALDFVQRPEQREGSDARPGWYRDEIAELDAKLAAAPK